MRTLHITNKLQEQIDTLHRLVGNTEWSGVLFYRIDTSIADPNCKIIPEFIFPMDIGSMAATDFDYSADLLDAYDIYEGAESCREGIIHTHHSMGAFHSKTDIDELMENAKNYDWYLSLVVDFQRTYKAKIAIAPTKIKVMVDRPSGSFEIDDMISNPVILDLTITYDENEASTGGSIFRRIAQLLDINKKRQTVRKTEDYYSGYQYKKKGEAHPEFPFPTFTDKKTKDISTINNQKKKRDTDYVSNTKEILQFLSAWIMDDPDYNGFLYNALNTIDTQFRKFTSSKEDELILDFYTDLATTFNKYFEDVFGMDMQKYIRTKYSKDTPDDYMIDQFTKMLDRLKSSPHLEYLIDGIEDVLYYLTPNTQPLMLDTHGTNTPF